VRGGTFVAVFIVALLGCRSRPDAPTVPAEPAAPFSAEASAVAPTEVAELAPTPSVVTDQAPGEGPPAQPVAAGLRRFAFDFEDADLPELVRAVSAITGKRLMYAGQIPPLHATLRSPEPITADEAYRAFLTILQANGLTIVERGRISTIVASASLINR